MSKIAVELPSKQAFSAVTDSIFKAHNGESRGIDIRLLEVDEIVSNEFQENFTLLFLAPLETDPQQGIYHLEHDGLGAMDLFLVPVKKDDSGIYFEAVFNLIKTAGA